MDVEDRRRIVRRSITVAPLALLSLAWSASLTTAGSAAGVPSGFPVSTLPDGSSVPGNAIAAPASVSGPAELTGSVGPVGGDTQQIVATSSTNGIPSVALAAYQRAETVINAADKSCHLSWQLIAAIGRVESDHGRFGASALSSNGLARPAIRGVALNGRGATAKILDTDAGQFDGDAVNDRAVGPMQFIPSTWSVVGVDADNDGVRNPQDIDDAALAAAVYLCSGEGASGDLATLSGQRASVLRYNHSRSYVDLVLSVMDAYLEGDFMAVPNGTVAAGYLVPNPAYGAGRGRDGDRGGAVAGAADAESLNGVELAGPSGAGAPGSQEQGDGGVNEEPNSGPRGGPGPSPIPDLPGVPAVTVPALPHTNIEPVDEVLTLAQAIVQCTLDGHLDNLLRRDDAFDRCVVRYTHAG